MNRMALCPVCGEADAPRPTGTATYTYSGITHKTRECAAISSLGEKVIRTKNGYRAASGLKACLDCFDHGRQHMYSGEDPHNPPPPGWPYR
jgi:hypothetical protein